MRELLVQTIAGVLGTIGFAILFRLKPIHWLYAGIDGLATCITYIILSNLIEEVIIINMVAAFVCAFGAEIIARIVKAPATVFILPGIIALVPGRTLYYTMSNLLSENYLEAGNFLLSTVEVAIALGGGIIAASIVRIVIFNTYDKLKK